MSSTKAAREARTARSMIECDGDFDRAVDHMDQSAARLGRSPTLGLLWEFSDGSVAMEYEITDSIVVVRGHFAAIAELDWQDREASEHRRA